MNDQEKLSTLEEEKRIARLKKDFAISRGWPKPEAYYLIPRNEEDLKDIPGSFGEEVFSGEWDGCPIDDPQERATLDLFPLLISQGHEGKWLHFGYGRKWYAIGKTREESRYNLMIQHPYQMPLSGEIIRKQVIEDEDAHEYYKWKAAKEAALQKKEELVFSDI